MTSEEKKILLISHDLVGPQMAGPGIRCLELARMLASEFPVALAIPNEASLEGETFELLSYALDDGPARDRLETVVREQSKVVMANGVLLLRLPFLCDLPVPLIADAYIPTAVESLAWHAHSGPERQEGAYRYSWEVTQHVARHADLVVCASERQRDYWLGALAAHGRLRQELYAIDPELRNLIDVVPFGCPAHHPEPGAALKGVWPGIGPQDQVILWGGGVWNWFDPMTLLRAMPLVLARHPNAKLVFLGANHPNPARVPEMQSARQARALSQELGLEGESVFWGDWVPYAERGAYLLDGDVGVSLHRTGVETRLAFRTRVLDAIWAGLPMVLTRGDVLADEFESLGLGYVVEAGAVDQVAQGISVLLDSSETTATRDAAFEQLRKKYSWEQVSQPLKRFCRAPYEGLGKRAAMDLAEAKAKADRASLKAEIDRLQRLVKGYESGRVMRTMAAFHAARRRLLGKR